MSSKPPISAAEKERGAVFALERDARRNAGCQPLTRISARGDPQRVQRDERPEPKPDHVGTDLRSKAHQDAGKEVRETGYDLRESVAAQLDSQQTRHVRSRSGEEPCDGPQCHQRVSE